MASEIPLADIGSDMTTRRGQVHETELPYVVSFERPFTVIADTTHKGDPA